MLYRATMNSSLTRQAPPPASETPPASPRQLWAWALYDWASQGYPTVIATFVFAAYFAKAVAVDEITGTSQWSWAMSGSALAVAVAGPVLGSVADQVGRRKPWVLVFSVLAALACASLWWVEPDPSFILVCLALVALANFAFEMAIVFYNAMLADLAPPGRVGRWSGWGWGLGYAGGLVCLGVALLLLVQPQPPLFGLDAEAAEPVRAVALLVAAWFAVFSLPLFLVTPDVPGRRVRPAAAIAAGLRTLRRTIGSIRHYRDIAWFLLARMVYTDGLNTLFAVGGLYAAVTMGMSFEEILLFGIAMNVTAGIGAFGFGWLDDAIGPKRTILIALAGLTGFGIAVLLTGTEVWFWVFAVPLGLFLGPAQSASRSMMARLAPAGLRNEMFGLYALSGKATAFLGPLVFGLVTAATGSQRWGMATILIFLFVGALLLTRVPEIERE